MFLLVLLLVLLYYYQCFKNELVKIKAIYRKQIKAIKNELELVKMKVNCFYAPMFLLVYVLLDYFQQYLFNYTKNFFPESDR